MASTTRSPVLIGLSVAGIVIVAGVIGFTTALVLDDPEAQVQPRVIEVTSTATGLPSPRATSVSEPVDGLERLQGVFRPSQEPDEWSLGGITIDVGPERWMRETIVVTDIDGDGERGSIWDELNGVAGRDVELWVRFDNTRDDAELFGVQQVLIRDPLDPEPPWAGG
jgi:hypothetical protein